MSRGKAGLNIECSSVQLPYSSLIQSRCIDLPRDLTDNVANEGSALADLALHGRDTGLGNAGGGLLLTGKRDEPVSYYCT